MAILRADNLAKAYKGRQIIRDVSLNISSGEIVGLLGPNGAGKTTLFDVLSGRLRPRGGSVTLAGEDVSHLPLHRRARLGLGYVPQTPTVFPDLTVWENLLAALESPARRGAPPDLEQAERGLTRFGLVAVRDRKAGVLSGGERRRVEVLRALLCRPVALLLDEPFAGLDPAGRKALTTGLASLPPRTALVVTDHAADDVLALCNRVLLLIDGAVVFDGPVTDFDPSDPRYRRYFGGIA